MKGKKISAVLALAVLLLATVVQAAGPTGAIFTTTPDGSIVNENVHYDMKKEVYLDGGPGPNAPQTAAGLDDGWYVFQVTDPSGKYLLSMDPSKCRVVEVEEGVITRLVNPTEFGLDDGYDYAEKNKDISVPFCHIQDDPDGEAGDSERHDTNTDADHGPPAIVVQLMPYGTTPNPGGVYKAWMEKFDTYLAKEGDFELVPEPLNGAAKKECPDFCADRDSGFGPPNTDTKTDNFKVKKPGKPCPPPEITVKKFHDEDFDGLWDPEETEVAGWLVELLDPLGVTTPLYTPETVLAAEPGTYSFTEEQRAGTLQTASYLDDLATVPFPSSTVDVEVTQYCEETHEVVFGNVGLGDITACKVYDRDADGEADPDEPRIPGWKMELWTGGAVFAEGFTGENGCLTFDDLLPGTYTVVEVPPPCGDWFSTGPTSQTFTIESSLDGPQEGVNLFTANFTNYCVGYADFDTKGYWHNKNGLQELTEADREYVNSLAPYSEPSEYFDAGDEPFDGFFEDGTPVDQAYSDGEEIWAAGTWQSEISHFLVDNNAASSLHYHKEQLAQQLLAFIFNVRHRLDGPDVAIELPDGTTVVASDLIAQAIAVWESGSDAEVAAMESLLDALNNSDAVPYIHYWPCDVTCPC